MLRRHELGAGEEPGPVLHRVAEARATFAHRVRGGGAREQADRSVACRDEELYGRGDRGAVVDDDRVRTGHEAVDRDDRHVTVTCGGEERGVVVDGDDDDPVDHLPHQEAHDVGLGLGVAS